MDKAPGRPGHRRAPDTRSDPRPRKRTESQEPRPLPPRTRTVTDPVASAPPTPCATQVARSDCRFGPRQVRPRAAQNDASAGSRSERRTGDLMFVLVVYLAANVANSAWAWRWMVAKPRLSGGAESRVEESARLGRDRRVDRGWRACARPVDSGASELDRRVDAFVHCCGLREGFVGLVEAAGGREREAEGSGDAAVAGDAGEASWSAPRVRAMSARSRAAARCSREAAASAQQVREVSHTISKGKSVKRLAASGSKTARASSSRSTEQSALDREPLDTPAPRDSRTRPVRWPR